VIAPLVIGCGSDGEADAPRTGTDSGVGSSGGPGGTDGTDSGTSSSGGASSSGSSGTSPTPCAPAGLHDDFSGAALDTTLWRAAGFMGWTLEIVAGHLTFTPVPESGTRTGVVLTTTSFALTECSTWLEVSRALPTNIQGEVNVSLATDSESLGLMRATQGKLLFVATVSGKAEMETIPYDPVAHRWWRFREAGGVLHMDTAPDARTWSERFKRVHGANVSAVKLGINVLNPNTPGVFEAPQFDNVNVIP
jgi:hypothetical protein